MAGRKYIVLFVASKCEHKHALIDYQEISNK